jgi:transposase-like protein
MELERITRRYLKPEQRRRIAERCERSGLTRSEFARRHGISLSSLQRWLSEARAAPKEVPAVVFREVTVSPPLSAAVQNLTDDRFAIAETPVTNVGPPIFVRGGVRFSLR